jgi:hypothetical protein
MEAHRNLRLTMLATAALFGLGIGNLWGIAGIFTRLGSPEWIWVFPILCLVVLVGFLCGVARAWWVRGAVVPLLFIVVFGWLFSAPWAAVNGKFTFSAWATWLLVLLGCALLAIFLAWLLERQRPGAAPPDNSLERTRER